MASAVVASENRILVAMAAILLVRRLAPWKPLACCEVILLQSAPLLSFCARAHLDRSPWRVDHARSPSDPRASPLYVCPVAFEKAAPRPFSMAVARKPAYKTETVSSRELFLHERTAGATKSAIQSAPRPNIERARIMDHLSFVRRSAACRDSREVPTLAHREQAVLHRFLEREQVVVGVCGRDEEQHVLLGVDASHREVGDEQRHLRRHLRGADE